MFVYITLNMPRVNKVSLNKTSNIGGHKFLQRLFCSVGSKTFENHLYKPYET